jgi:hypothetical protein
MEYRNQWKQVSRIALEFSKESETKDISEPITTTTRKSNANSTKISLQKS